MAANKKPPEATSAENFYQYLSGRVTATGRGTAWRDVETALVTVDPAGETLDVPAINEPFLLWVTSGEVEIHERENGGPWQRSLVKKGAFFFTAPGAPYDCRWKTLTPEPFEYMLVLIGLPIMKRAFEEVCGIDSAHAVLRDASGFEDETLNALLGRLREEMGLRRASPLFVQGIAQSIAIHLVRHYAVLTEKKHTAAALPGYKLRQITDWMSANAPREFDLARLASMAGLSKFHFHRLFKNAMGVTPAHHHIKLRMDAARRLLRETKRSVAGISLDIGDSNPSHFAQLFRRETGLSPSEYRRRR